MGHTTDPRLIIERAVPKSVVMVDESMLPWLGPHWKSESLLSQRDWIQQLFLKSGIEIFIIHSWTKIWACPGIRLGSVVCPTEAQCKAMKKRQVPWSLNCAALAFLTEVVHDEEYLLKTWELTPQWRAAMCDFFAREFPVWKVFGESWTSWIWVDVGEEAVAKKMSNDAVEDDFVVIGA